MHTLQIKLLGHFQLIYEGNPVTSLQQPRLQSLLAYLALHSRESVSRQQLSFLYWPDVGEAQARANLRKALFDLRRAAPELDSCLDFDTQTVIWRADVEIRLDLAEFVHAAAVAESKEQDRAILRPLLEQAVTLYTGELLPACYDDWVLREREQLHRRYLNLLDELVLLLEVQHAYAAAIGVAQRLLHDDPLQESTYRTLMRLYVQRGDRAHALRTYHACARVLRQELDVEPSPETQAAYHRLLATEDVAAPLATEQTATPALEVPLVGRTHELARLQQAWRAAMAGQPQLALIDGEAGIGKSRLAAELSAWAERQGSDVAQSRCYAAEGRLAYAPVSEWLRAQPVRARFAQLDAVWLSEVARLVPDLLAQHPRLAPPQPLTEAWQRQRFREALARAVLGSDRPLLLVIDDLQWCDQETLEWLHYLLRFGRARLLVVGTVRAEELDPGHPLQAMAASLRRGGALWEIELDRLDAAETATLAARMAQHPLDAQSTAALFAATEGSPLFVVEMMRAQAGLPQAEAAPLEATPLPPKVQSVLQARLNQLAPATRELAGLAATVGRAFTLDVLAAVRQGDDAALVRGLDELWRRRIIREQGEDAYDFTHDRLREAAYAAVSPAGRRVLHKRVAEALEWLHANDPDTVSAHVAVHYEQAGLPDKAIVAYLRAADAAQRIYAHAEANAHLTRALAIITRQPAGTERQQQELQLQLALAISETSLHGVSAFSVRAAYERAFALAQQLGRPEAGMTASLGLAVSELTGGDLRLALERGHATVALAQQAPPGTGVAEAYGVTGIILLHLGRWQESRSSFEMAAAHGPYRWDPQWRRMWAQHQGITDRRHRAIVLWHLGYPDQAETLITATLADARELGHPYTLAATYVWAAWLYAFRRQPALTLKHVERALALIEQNGLQAWLDMCLFLRGQAMAQQGELTPALEDISSAIAKHVAAGGLLHRTYFLAVQAETLGLAGRPAEGLPLLTTAESFSELTGERFAEPEISRVRGELLRQQGAAADGVEPHLLRAMAIAHAQAARSLELRAAMALAHLWQQEHKAAQACTLLAETYAWFSEGFTTPDLLAAQALLRQLEHSA